uniref:Uncharacterized protein n=1 Tax=viral metagenome TaxID=1070528 RepID=A0A6H2A4B7_9ZZZZ
MSNDISLKFKVPAVFELSPEVEYTFQIKDGVPEILKPGVVLTAVGNIAGQDAQAVISGLTGTTSSLETEVLAKVTEVLKANPTASSNDLTGLLTMALSSMPGASAVKPFISAIVGLAGSGKDVLGDALGALTNAKADAPKSQQAELDAAIEKIKAELKQ